MSKQASFFTRLTNFFEREKKILKEREKIEEFFKEFNWLYKMHLKNNLSDSYLKYSLEKLVNYDRNVFFIALGEYLVANKEVSCLDIFYMPCKKDKTPRSTESAKTFIEICIETKNSNCEDPDQESRKNKIIIDILDYFSYKYYQHYFMDDLETFRKLIKNGAHSQPNSIAVTGRRDYLSKVFSYYQHLIFYMKQNEEITDEHDMNHPKTSYHSYETLETLKTLFENSPNISERNDLLRRILNYDVDKNFYFFKEVIKFGTDPNQKSVNSITSIRRDNINYYYAGLQKAVTLNKTEISIELLKAEPLMRQAIKNSPYVQLLHISVSEGNLKLTEFLLVFGANPHKIYEGETPLHTVLLKETVQISMVKLLLKYDYPIVPNQNGELPIDIARRRNLFEVVKLIEAKSDSFRDFSPLKLPDTPEEILPNKIKNKNSLPNRYS